MSLNNIQETLLELASQESEEYVDKWLGLFKDAMHGKEVLNFLNLVQHSLLTLLQD